MQSGWIDFGISHVPGLGTDTGKWLSGAIRSECDAIRIAGLRPPGSSDSMDCMRGIDWCFCGGFFAGPPKLLLKFAGEVLRQVRHLVANGEITWEVNLWARVHARHPAWFAWYEAGFNERILKNCQ
jgi:hypothetical protein